MAFKDIKGQDRAIEFFRNCVNVNRLAHAYLFLGPGGLGKTLFAKTLAKFLNCENQVKDEARLIDCCDSCISCRKIEDFNHADVHWIERQGQSQKISIDDIRVVQKEISLKAYEGRFKVFIILEAQQMSEEAANSLLKTLEEPPSFSLIILTSTGISGLLPTIISRCQIIKFYPLDYEKLKEILTHELRLTCDDAHFLSTQAEGRIGRALSLRDEDALTKKNRLIDRICQIHPALFTNEETLRSRKGGVNRRFSSIDIFNIKDKKELTNQIRYLLDWFRDILIFKVGQSSSSIINADRIKEIESQAGQLRLQDLEQIIIKIDQTHRLIEQNVNRKLALEVMLRGIAKCKK